MSSSIFGDEFSGTMECERQVPSLSNTGKKMLEEAKDRNEKVMLSWETGSVFVGKEIQLTKFNTITHRFPWKSDKWVWEEALCKLMGWDLHKIQMNIPFQKDRGSYYTYKLGVRPTKFLEMYHACMCKAFIPQDLRCVVDKFCRKAVGRLDHGLIENLTLYQDTIRELLSDGMEQIIPLFLTTREDLWKKYELTPSVSNLRKILGKGLWKKVLKNSNYRNKMIASVLYRDTLFTKVQLLQQLPTGLIPWQCPVYNLPSLDEARIFKELRIIGKKRLQQKITHIIKDTKMMSGTLSLPIPKSSTKWSVEKWEKHHDYLVEQQRLQRYSKDKFEWLEIFEKEYKTESGEYTAHILDNAFDIREEGDSMHHCVGGYSDSVKRGTYLVLSIRDKEGLRSSTLGLRVAKKDVRKLTWSGGDDTGMKMDIGGGITFSQHYKKCNQSVVCKREEAFAKDLLIKLNIQYKTEGVL